jgi:high-affinity K+ transport system ATPase subunit B
VTQQAKSAFTGAVLRQALVGSFTKLDPRVQMRNPVMFVVEIGAAITTVGWFLAARRWAVATSPHGSPSLWRSGCG